MPEQQQKKVKAVKAVRVTAKEAAPQEQPSSTPPARQTRRRSQPQSAPQPQGVQASNVLFFDDLEYHASQRERHWASTSRKKPFYDQWWFWLAAALLVIAVAILAGLL